MRAADIIIKKRDGQPLAEDEIRFFVQGAVERSVPDYQVAAWLMAVFFRGMNPKELAALTSAMMESGERFDLSAIEGVTVDKHSTGGVGDKVSLILAPLAASAGVKVPMVSGRSLGHTGGTLDKLESIPGPGRDGRGYDPYMTGEAFARQVADVGCAIIGQTDNFVPADKLFYALRDVTGTIESIPLIAASILSKKFASGADAFIMDVKTGSGAFMREEADARRLAETMRDLGREMGRPVACLLTDMSQPLGRWVGNAVEVRESVATLKGEGPDDLTELCLALGAQMARLAGVETNIEKARSMLEEKLSGGAALEVFARMVEAQGGNPRITDDPAALTVASERETIKADADGWLAEMNTRAIGLASMLLGGGRETMDDAIDPTVGIEVHHRLGDEIKKGEPLFTLYYNKNEKRDAAAKALQGAARLDAERPAPPPLIRDFIAE